MSRKSIIRNYDNVLLALSIALSIFMIMNAIQIISVGREQLTQSNYQFSFNYLVGADKIEVSDIEEIAEKTKDKNMNCYLDGVIFNVGSILGGMNVLIYVNDNYDTAWNKDENSLIIGHTIHDFASSAGVHNTVKFYRRHLSNNFEMDIFCK